MRDLGIQPAVDTREADEARSILDSSMAGAHIIRGGILRFGAYVTTAAMSVLSIGLLTRHLGVVRFGEYTTIIALVTLISAVTDAGMSNVGVHEYAIRDNRVDRNALMRDLLGLRLALSVAGVAIAVVFAIAAGYDNTLLVGTLTAGLGTVAIVWQHTFSIPVAASLRLGALSVLELGRQVISVAMIAALVAAGAGVLPLLTVMLLANLVLIPPAAWLARGQIPARPSIDLRAWASLLQPTLFFSLASAVGTIYVFTAQLITSLVASHHQNGLFAVSFRVFIVVSIVPGLVVSGALPLLSRAARGDQPRLEYALQRIFEVSLIGGVGLVLGLVTGAPFVINVVAGAQYAGSVPVLRIQALALLASFLLAGWSFALLSLKRYGGQLIANAVALVVSCALTVIFASTDGAVGSAVATLCGEATLASGYLIALAAARPTLRPKTAPVLKVVTSAIPASAVALIALASGLPSVLAAVAGLAIYGAAILLTKALPDEIAELLPRRSRTPAR